MSRRKARWSTVQPPLFKGAPKIVERERDVLGRLKQVLALRGVYHQRTNSGHIITRKGSHVELCREGTPDLLTLYRGLLVWTETKAAGEKARSEQEREHLAIRASGGLVVVAYDYEDVFAEYREIDQLLDRLARRFDLKGRPTALDLLKAIDAAT